MGFCGHFRSLSVFKEPFHGSHPPVGARCLKPTRPRPPLVERSPPPRSGARTAGSGTGSVGTENRFFFFCLLIYLGGAFKYFLISTLFGEDDPN